MPGRRPGAGALDQRVAIKEEVRETVASGGANVTYQTLGTVWAMVEPVRAAERVIADREKGVATYRFTVRDSSLTRQITTAHVVTWRGVDLNVTQAPEPGGRGTARVFEAEAGAGIQ